MPDAGQAGLWGLVAASSLVIGAVVGVGRISAAVVALMMAFGAGALVCALAFDLTEEASRGGTLTDGARARRGRHHLLRRATC